MENAQCPHFLNMPKRCLPEPIKHPRRPDFKTHTTQEEIDDLGLPKENPQHLL
jgi:hypothetical protein